MSQLRIGTSGYQYDHWRGILYPTEIPKRRWFEIYAAHFDTVEVNNTFYRLPETHTFEAWRDQAPPNFCYALKFSRFGTHIKRLKDPEEPIARFTTRASRLGHFLGPILVQLPPNMRPEPERLERFLKAAPRRYRWAVEFRHGDWLREETYALLRRHRAALCIHDKIADHPRVETTDWIYLRYHWGEQDGSYSADQLAREAEWIRGWRDRGLDVYAYFNNDLNGHAVHNATELRRLCHTDAITGEGTSRETGP